MAVSEGGFLNDTQYAFLMGRQSDERMCGCSCHVFAEYNCPEYDEKKLRSAWIALGKRHPVLHSRIEDSGEIFFEPEDRFEEKLKITDYSTLSTEEALRRYAEAKNAYISRNMPVSEGEVFVLHCFIMPEDSCMLCFEGDCVAYDITSFQIFIRDFGNLYLNYPLPHVPEHYNPYAPEFTEKIPNEKKKTDRRYWQEKASGFGVFPAKSYLDVLPHRPQYSAHTARIGRPLYAKLSGIAEKIMSIWIWFCLPCLA